MNRHEVDPQGPHLHAADRVVDLCRGWRTPNLETVVEEIAEHCRRYGVGTVTGDRYSAEWVVSAFRRHGIDYQHATQNRSEVSLELHPLIATGRAVLLDHPAMLAELRQLEQRPSPPPVRRPSKTGSTSPDARGVRASPPPRPPRARRATTRCALTPPPARAISLPRLATRPHPPLCLRVANGSRGAHVRV